MAFISCQRAYTSAPPARVTRATAARPQRRARRYVLAMSTTIRIASAAALLLSLCEAMSELPGPVVEASECQDLHRRFEQLERSGSKKPTLDLERHADLQLELQPASPDSRNVASLAVRT